MENENTKMVRMKAAISSTSGYRGEHQIA